MGLDEHAHGAAPVMPFARTTDAQVLARDVFGYRAPAHGHDVEP